MLDPSDVVSLGDPSVVELTALAGPERFVVFDGALPLKFMTAANLQVAVRQTSTIADFDSVVTAEATGLVTIPDFLRTAGYNTAGDGGAALYTQGSAGAGSFQTAEGTHWRLAVQPLYPEMFGAAGDGVTDDTTTLQAAINWTVTNNVVLRLRSRTYLVTNITFPHNTAYDSNPVPLYQSLPRILGEPGATIKKKTGADNTYLAASARWATNVAFPTSPIWIEGVRFDGANIATTTFVSVAWGATYKDCVFTGATQDGAWEPATTKNGTAIGGPRSNGLYRRNTFYNNGHYGLNVDPFSGSAVISDYWLLDNLIYDNGPGNASLGQISGWVIRGNHAYWSAVSPASGNWSVTLGDGLASSIGGNIWEGHSATHYGLQVGGGASGPVTIEGDQFEVGLGCSATFNSAACKLIRVRNSKFIGSTLLQHAQSDATCELVSENNSFDASGGYAFSGGGSHLGLLTSSGDRIGTDQNVYSGVQKSGDLSVETRSGVFTPASFPYQSLAADQFTARRTATLSTDIVFNLPASPKRGMKRRIVRAGAATGAHNLNIQTSGGGAVISLGSAATFADCEYDSAAASWVVTASGAAA